ncbi:hypothetical protein Hanom_Chr04g00318101 [Helianthus anomalus]
MYFNKNSMTIKDLKYALIRSYLTFAVALRPSCHCSRSCIRFSLISCSCFNSSIKKSIFLAFPLAFSFGLSSSFCQ